MGRRCVGGKLCFSPSRTTSSPKEGSFTTSTSTSFFFSSPRNPCSSRLLLAAALAVAATTKATAVSPSAMGLTAAEEEAVRSHEADYAHFAELVATVMIVREGGVDAALDAIPILHDSTDAYISALSLNATSATNPLGKDWAGLSDAAAALIAKNYTKLEQSDPLAFKRVGTVVGAKLNSTKLPIDPLLSRVEEKLINDFNNGGEQKLNEIADLTTFGKASDTALIKELNDRFGKYNVEFKGKSITAPSRFSNAAAVISKAITGVSLSATAINFAPCLISISPSGATASLEIINIQPQVIATKYRFATMNAQGFNLQPVLILIAPQATNVQPQGAQVAPFLIAVSPVGANVQPQGFVYAPQDIAVGPIGALSSPRGSVYSPTGLSLGKTIHDLTPPKPAGRQGKRRLLAAGASGEEAATAAAAAAAEEQEAAAAAAADAADAAAAAGEKKGADEKKILVSDDPLDLSQEFPNDYRNWAAVLSQVLLTKEGNSAEKARASLERLMLSAHGHLAKVASGEEMLPRFHLQDPVLSAASSSSSPFPPPPFLGDKNVTPSSFPATSATAFSSSATFLNYAPCVLSESATGASAGIVGLNIIPTLFSFSGSTFEVDAALVNIQPQLIYLVTKVNQVEPQGFNVQPGLIYIGPIGVNVQPQGASFQPIGINVSPGGAIAQPVGASVTPTRISVGDVGVGYTPHGRDNPTDTTDDDGSPVGGL